MKRHLIGLVIIAGILSCNQTADTAKHAVNKGGELVGKTASEFAEGVSDGVKEVMQPKVVLSENLKSLGLSLGKISVTNDSLNNNKNVLVLYIIANNDVNKSLSAKAFNEMNQEMGRTQFSVSLNKGDAGYFDVIFNKRTHLESTSTIYLD